MLNNKHFIDQLQQIVATPSVSSTQATIDMGNRKVIDLLANWLDTLGFVIDIQAVNGQTHKANLIATLPGTEKNAKRGLVFSGHTDTVPYDQALWAQDPFTLTIKDEKAYGLGATDMKGFFPTVIAAVQPFLEKPLKHPLIILATADEETTMSGARALTSGDFAQAACAVVGEPTGMQPIRMHKGVMMEAVRVTGSSGHSSNPALGNNALDAMHEVIGDLKQFRKELQAKYQNAGFAINVPTMNFGCIHGGDNPNRICGHCDLEFDLRPLPGMKLDELRTLIDQRLRPIADDYQIDIQRRSLFSGIDAFEQNADSELIRTVEKLTGRTSDSVAFGTESPILQALGLEVVVMGPGNIDQAHQPDEFIDLKQIGESVEVLQGLIQHYCV